MENKNKFYILYKTTNLKNGKFYIGVHETNNINDGYLGSGKVLRNSVYYHGKENFKREIIEFCDNRNSLLIREREIVNEELIKEPKCINLVVGGLGGNFKNEKHKYNFHANGGKRVRKIFREKHLDKFYNDIEYGKKWFENYHEAIKNKRHGEDNHFFNKTHNDETKKKIGQNSSLKQKRSNNSQFGTCWITNGIENKKIKKGENIPNDWKVGRVITYKVL